MSLLAFSLNSILNFVAQGELLCKGDHKYQEEEEGQGAVPIPCPTLLAQLEVITEEVYKEHRK